MFIITQSDKMRHVCQLVLILLLLIWSNRSLGAIRTSAGAIRIVVIVFLLSSVFVPKPLTAASVPSGQVQVVGGLQSPQGPFRPLPRKSPRLQVGKIDREGRGQSMYFHLHVSIGRNIDLTVLL